MSGESPRLIAGAILMGAASITIALASILSSARGQRDLR